MTNTELTGKCLITQDSTTKIYTITCSNYNTTAKIDMNTTFIIKLYNLINPRSLKPTSSFSISTFTTDNYQIDSKSTSISVQLTTAANISNVIVTPNSYEVGENTDYLFEVFPKTMIITNDIFVIIFPAEIKLSSSVAVVNKDSLNANLVFEKVNNGDGTTTLKITLKVTNGSLINTKFAFMVQNIKNPPSTKISSSFSFIIVTNDTPTSFDIEVYNTAKTIQMITAGVLSNTVIKALIDQIGTVSDYTFQLMPSNYIPKDGFILVKYPSQITVIDGTCFGVVGISTSITCTNNVATRTIKISGGFPNDYSPSLINLTIKGLKNNLDSSTTITSTDSFEISTTTPDNFDIDKKTTGLNVTFSCRYPCQTCETDTVTCKSCVSNVITGILFLLSGQGTCVKTCPDGYYYTTTSCEQCSPTCKTCDPANKDKCISCPSNLKYFVSSQNKCVDICPDGTYLDIMNNVCLKCESPCLNCYSKTLCASCLQDVSNSLKLYFSREKSCVNECPTGSTVRIDSNCVDCDQSCSTCETSTQNCLSCSAKYAFYQGKCVDNCPTGLIPVNGKCLNCNDKCEVCGTSLDTCKVCKKEYIQKEEICLIPQTSCSDGYYFDSQICYSCNDKCTKCISQNICTECRTGFLMQASMCVDKCSDGYFQSGNKCVTCNSTCKTCNNNADNCILCATDLKFFNNTCISENPKGSIMTFN